MSFYEMVLGIEVHVEIKTESKIFCSCPTKFGAQPNTQCCPVCMGFPGTLPVLNRDVVVSAVKAGLATGCTIARFSKQDRKNYFYPDLPKAYQISQYDLPLCSNGKIGLSNGRDIGIVRIHIEEDAGKLVHTPDGTLCDYNRCGVPLIEIVSAPDFRSSAEVLEYLHILRGIMLYTDVSDCRMEEGSMRCDINLSVHREGEPFGTRTEMKNLNSFKFIKEAIDYEYERQCAILRAGGSITQETRRYDPQSGQTYQMRRKENADDYRYFPDPDLPPIEISESEEQRIRALIPELPEARKRKYADAYGISESDAEILTAVRELSDLFEETARLSVSPKTAANLILTDAPRFNGASVEAADLAELADLISQGKVSSTAGKRVLAQLFEGEHNSAEIAERLGLWQLSDTSQLEAIARRVIEDNAKIAADYRAGKKKSLQALVGLCMKETKGRANPTAVTKLLESVLEE